MRASLDTNVIIHLYRAELQGILFDLFDEGVFIYEQIRSMDVGRILRTFKIKKNVEVTYNGKIII